MNLNRLGHYHIPTGPDDAGYCQTALVCGVNDEPDGESVNIRVWDSDAEETRRLKVPVSAPRPSQATFHLGPECPFGR